MTTAFIDNYRGHVSYTEIYLIFNPVGLAAMLDDDNPSF